VQDIERPLFFSTQSRHARVAPEGAALVHAFKQLDPRRPTHARQDEQELEGLLDAAQPCVPGLDNPYLAGDWIGPRGFLADTSFGSAREAAQLVLAELRPDAVQSQLAAAAA
jgi:hypothetical protein